MLYRKGSHLISNFSKWIEGQGSGLRKYLTVTPYDILNPFELANTMRVHVLSLKEVKNISEQVLTQLIMNDAKSWDAGCIRLPMEQAIILYNPTRAQTRLHATIMEELAHLHLKHKGSELVNNGGICYRSFKKGEEKQAYAVGAAALIPAALLRRAREARISRMSLAAQHTVSEELVAYRENISQIKLR
jgi:hypothetical protein